jgi:hypothetical protein
VRALIARAMSRDPADRFATAADMGFVIEQALRAMDARPNIADLFPEDSLRPPRSSEAVTIPQDLAHAPTQLATPTGERPTPPASSGEAPAAGTGRAVTPRASPWVRVVFTLAAVAALAAIGALVWALVST